MGGGGGGVVNSVFVEPLKSTTSTKQNIVCGCVYKPPSMSLAAFNELLSNILAKSNKHENKYVYLFGDFNVNTMPNIKDNVNIQDLKKYFFI